ncbi:hypothetical protein [Ornithinimicrobium kibberense]
MTSGVTDISCGPWRGGTSCPTTRTTTSASCGPSSIPCSWGSPTT